MVGSLQQQQEQVAAGLQAGPGACSAGMSAAPCAPVRATEKPEGVVRDAPSASITVGLQGEGGKSS